MTSFRLRQWGAAEWLQVTLTGEDDVLEIVVRELLERHFTDCSLHVQELVEGSWVNLDEASLP